MKKSKVNALREQYKLYKGAYPDRATFRRLKRYYVSLPKRERGKV